MILETILLNIHWIIVSFIIIFNVLLGYKNGTKKTIYYVIVDLFLTITILFLLTFVSIKSYYTPELLLEKIEKSFKVSEQFKEYFLIPELSEFIFSIFDLVIRFVLFIGIYPIIKWILRVTLFRYIYNKILKDNKRKPIKDKRFGALLGFGKGLVISLIFLSPVISVNKINKSLKQKSNNKININTILEDISAPNNMKKYINNITINNNLITKVKIDNYIFDISYNQKDIKLEKEINNILDIYIVFKNDDKNRVDKLLNLATNSKLLDPLINPIIKHEINKSIEKELNLENKKDELGNLVYSEELINEIEQIDYKEELKQINNIFNNKEKITSINIFINHILDPLNLYNLSNYEKEEFINIIEQLSTSNLTIFTNLFIENIIREPEINKNFKWANDEIKYLNNKLNFILKDYNYIKNNKEEIIDIFQLFLKYNLKELSIENIDNELIDFFYEKINNNQIFQKIIPLIIEYEIINNYGFNIDKLIIEQLNEITIKELLTGQYIENYLKEKNINKKDILKLINNNKFNQLTNKIIYELDIIDSYFNKYFNNISVKENIIAIKNLYNLLLKNINYNKLINLENMNPKQKAETLINIGDIKQIEQIKKELTKLNIINQIKHEKLPKTNELNKDIIFLLDLSYTFFKPLKEETKKNNIENINILEHLDINRLINLFDNQLKEKNSALLYNIINYLKQTTNNQKLKNAKYNSELWQKEIYNYIMGILFAIPEIINKENIYFYSLIDLFKINKDEFMKKVILIKKDNGLASTYLNESILIKERA